MKEDCLIPTVKDKIDALLWLADAHRQNDFAPSAAPKWLHQLLGEPSWSRALFTEEFRLPYEPRCLAVNHSGKRVAVGTKAGTLHVISWQESGSWEVHRGVRKDFKNESAQAIGTEAIRALTFLSDSVVAAGTAAGAVLIFDVSAPNSMEALAAVPPPLSDRQQSGWFRRFLRLIPLIPPGEPLRDGAVALGLTQSRDAHLLTLSDGKYSVETDCASRFVPSLKKNVRLADGVWDGGGLWLLGSGSDQRIYRFEPLGSATDNSKVPIEHVWDEEINLPHRAGELRRLVASQSGLCILASNYIVFVPFDSSNSSRPDVRRARWTFIHRVNDVALWKPFSSPDLDQESWDGWLKGYSPVEESTWAIAGSVAPGLSWLRWPRTKESNKNQEASSGSSPAVARSLASLQAAPPNPAGVGDRSILSCAMGIFREGKKVQGPAYLASASRDHRLIVTSLLHKPQVRYVLKNRLPQLLPQLLAQDPQDPQELQDPQKKALEWLDLEERYRKPGLALWILGARIYRDLEVESRTKRDLLPDWSQAQLDPMLELLDASDLRRLARILNRSLGSSLKRIRATYGEQDQLDELNKKVKIFRRWSFHLLRRAFQISGDEPRHLARRIYDALARRQTRRGGNLVWKTLGPFAGFLRKWIVNGQTYHLLKSDFLNRILRNQECGYDLDALVYVAKLIRRRFDLQWRTQAAPDATAATWSIVSEEAGRFSIQSFTDGSVTALSSQGVPLRWRAKRSNKLVEQYLKISDDDFSLTHRQAETYRKRYRHGPYVRRLLLRRLDLDGSDSRYLLVGCWRGWRPKHRSEVGEQPRFFAILLSYLGESSDKILIEAFSTLPVVDDLYDIFLLSSEIVSSGQIFRFLAGTRGTWSEGSELTPFVEFRVNVARSYKVSVEAVPFKVIPAERGRPTRAQHTRARLQTFHNPCWCMTTVEVGGDLWLWAGFEDGRLRCFRRRAREDHSEEWLEGGGASGNVSDWSITCSSSIWQILAIPIDGDTLLAYGTADGVVGVVSLGALKTGGPMTHQLHSRETAPICGLMTCLDEGRRRLLSLSQDGYVTLYCLETTEPSERGHFEFPGMWTDRFPLQHTARTLTSVLHRGTETQLKGAPWLFRSPVPAILVGSGDGHIYHHHLLVPKGTNRRSSAANDWLEPLKEGEERDHRLRANGQETTPTLAYCVTTHDVGTAARSKEFYSWLRMLDTGGPEMVRLSFWFQLRDHEPDFDHWTAEDARQYLDLVKHLGDESLARKPFGRDPAKILWELVSRVCNAAAARAIDNPEETENLLGFYNELNITVNDLCNRWIGSNQASEARVLIHSFNTLFSWPSIVLIAWLNPPENAIHSVAESRRFLLFDAVQRQFNYGEPMVPLETLRVLNRAMRWAVVFLNRRRRSPDLRIGLLPGQIQSDSESRPTGTMSLGFYDLMTLVGKLAARHHDTLSLAEPLTTEISRFFALSILLVPDCAFIVGHTMSENRLLDRGPELSKTIAFMADQLADELPLQRSSLLDEGLSRFRAYCTPLPSFRPGRPPSDEWWDLMTRGLPHGDSAHRITDDGLVSEQRQLLYAALGLAHLGELPQGTNLKAIGEAQDWLAGDGPLRYFFESHRYLRRLKEHSDGLREQLQKDLELSLQEKVKERATEICEKSLRELESADVFEPQRSYYREVIESWRDLIERRAQRAITVLGAIDKFNRHVYRSTADNLMTNILELVLQVAPLSFERPSNAPLRHLIEDALKRGHPLLKDIFLDGTDLVERTHLAGTLLELARDHLSGEAKREPPGDYITLDVVRREAQRRAEHLHLEAQVGRSFMAFAGSESVPGTRAIWATMIYEWVRNVARYAEPERWPNLHVDLHETPERGAVFSIAGERPFIDCLRERDELRKQVALGEVAVVATRLAKLAEETQIPGPNKKIGSKPGSGMGLYLIRTICRHVGLEARMSLRDLRDGQRAAPEDPKLLIECPLCLEISW